MAKKAGQNTLAVADYTEDPEDITMEIIEGISTVTGKDALDLPPLFEVIDPDALNALVYSLDADGSIQFEYMDHEVTVCGLGSVSIRALNKVAATVSESTSRRSVSS